MPEHRNPIKNVPKRTRFSLKVWDTIKDPYDHEQLADNFVGLNNPDFPQPRLTPEQQAQVLLDSTAVYLDSNGESEHCAARQDTGLAQSYLDKAHSLMNTRTFNVGDVVKCHATADYFEGEWTVIALEAKAVDTEIGMTLEQLDNGEGQLFFTGEQNCYMPAELLPMRPCPECETDSHLGDDYMCWRCRDAI